MEVKPHQQLCGAVGEVLPPGSERTRRDANILQLQDEWPLSGRDFGFTCGSNWPAFAGQKAAQHETAPAVLEFRPGVVHPGKETHSVLMLKGEAIRLIFRRGTVMATFGQGSARGS